MQEIVLKVRYFERGLSKRLKKVFPHAFCCFIEIFLDSWMTMNNCSVYFPLLPHCPLILKTVLLHLIFGVVHWSRWFIYLAVMTQWNQIRAIFQEHSYSHTLQSLLLNKTVDCFVVCSNFVHSKCNTLSKPFFILLEGHIGPTVHQPSDFL